MKKLFDYLKLLFNKYNCAIYSSTFFMILTHIYYFTKRLGNEDDLNFTLFSGRVLESGRWSTGTFLTGEMLTPMVKFVFAIIIITLVSVLICDMFKFKKKISMILTSLVLATFPSLATSFGYLFMVEIYMGALVFSVLAVYITIKFKFGFILAGLLIALSLGNYQSYIGVASALSILYLIKMIIDKENTKDVLFMFLRLFLMGVLGTIFYFIILKIYLQYFNVSLSTYKGADSMGIPPIGEWPRLICRTYWHYVGYFMGFSLFKSSIIFIIFRIVLFLITFIMLIFTIKHEKIYKKRSSMILLIIFVLLIPLSINIIDFMAYKTDISVLNIYQFVLTYLLCIYIIENYFTLNPVRIGDFCYFAPIICFIITGGHNFVISNSYYYKLEKFNQYTESLNNRLLLRIESTEGYDYDMPVMIVHEENNNDFYNRLFNTDEWKDIVKYDPGLWGRFIGYQDLYYYNYDSKIITFINNQFGVQIVRANDDQKSSVYNSKEYQELKDWPSRESIKIINDVLVVKI